MGEITRQLFIQAALIMLNAFFAATEIAVISLNTGKLKKMQEGGDKTAGRLLKMAEEPAGFLSTIQIGITLAGFLGSAFAAESFSGYLSDWIYNGLSFRLLGRPALDTVSVIIITVILSYFTLIFGELVPKRIAMQKPYEVARMASRVVAAIAFIMRPVIAFLSLSTNGVLRLLGMKTEAGEEQVTEDEIRMMLDLGEENGAIEEEEKEWIQNVFEFNDISVQEAMTREYEMESLYEGDSDAVIVEKIEKTGLSRFPVFDEEGEAILGILYAREYLLNLSRGKEKDLKTLLHPAYFVPESVRADDLFKEMQKKKMHMAVVIGEYGEISGIITMEDLLEEIVGNIYDEFDVEEDAEIVQLEENLWRFPGSTPIEEAAACLGIELSGDAYETVGGMVLSCLNAIPEDGTTVDVETSGLLLHAQKIKNRRIGEVLIRKGDSQPAENL